MTTVAPRDARSQIAAMTYDGVESLGEAVTLRQKMAAAVEVAKRARVDAREHMWNAREMERALGRMILAARAAGDLATDGQHGKGIGTLDSFRLSADLAAYAVRLARIPEEDWQRWHEQDTEPTQRSVDAAARAYEKRVDEEQRRRSEAEAAVDEVKADIELRISEMEQLAAAAREYAERTAAAPLLHDEVDTTAAEFVLPATAADPRPERDPVADEWTALFRRIAALNQTLQVGPARLPRDFQADITVLAARDLAKAATASVAVWIRHVNDLYISMSSEGQR